MNNPNKHGEAGPDIPSEALILTNLEPIYRFCLRLCCGRVADAEDLAQDVFVQAWQHRDGFAGRSKITTWLMRIALNRHMRVCSQTKETQPFSPDTEILAVPGHSDQTLDRLELARALEQLPDSLRTVFLLVKVEGLKYREVAALLNLPIGTVQWQVHEAAQRLRTALLTENTSLSASEQPIQPILKEVSHGL